MRNLYLTIILILTGFCAAAQTGMLVTTKTDTIRGDIRILSYDKLDRVQVSNKGKKEIYTALQILYLNIDSTQYKPVQKEDAIRIMKVIKSGYLSLYGFNYPNQNMFDGRYMVKLNGASLEMPNLTFKKMMANFLDDCDVLRDKLKNGEFGKSDLEAIIDEYNLCVTQLKPEPEKIIASSEELTAIQNLSNKIKGLNFESREDALDILRDISLKIQKDEKVSKYLIGGLETALKDQSSLSEELNILIGLLKK